MTSFCEQCGTPYAAGAKFCNGCGKQVSGPVLASVGRRWAASLIDSVFVYIVVLVIVFIAPRSSIADATTLLIYAVWFVYDGAMTASGGATLGKKALGIVVVARDGTPLSAGRAFGRSIVKMIGALALALGWIWALLNKDHQGWHDLAVSSLVVRKESVAATAPSTFAAAPAAALAGAPAPAAAAARATCASCGRALGADERFCGNCGRAVAT